MRIVLASSSLSRKSQLENLGLSFVTEKPPFDEELFKQQHPALAPADLVMRLALGKAQSVAKVHPADLIIGSDQMVVCDSEILGKGHTPEGTAKVLRKLSGKRHDLLTSIVVITPQQTLQHLETVQIGMHPLSDQQIQDYIRQDQPFECAGGYKFERAGVALMSSVTSQDPSAILGLPILALTRMLLDLGFGFPFQKGSSK